ncbi:hypothetical protein D1B33_10150 [Lysinibacillus yapensis]|uniref:Transcriptional regulator n=1 Tax=Ureibacillus yapensis TaxID=2304605 RepID=A0A396SDT3_9BACL|nr:hypothetical protein [Lysinibacillus yapensis]RHW36744.1 hypothetical protein D1B33_10150 [Lysinibacillus yapensis]
MYKVGIVGPERSVERIIYYAEKIQNDLTFIGYSYHTASETVEILDNHHNEVDFWLFSGNIPYTIAQQSKHYSKERMQFINISINSFYRGILELSHEIGRLAKNVSVDTLDILEQDYQTRIEELKGLLDHLFIKRFNSQTTIDEIAEHHLALWKNNEIDIVMTAYPAVQQKLKDKNIPVYWIGPMEQDIYYTLQLFREKIQTFYYKETQTTALIVQVKNFDKIKKEYAHGYGLHFRKLNLTKIVLQICEKIDGYFIDEGNGRFILFSSRGIVERNIDSIYEMISILEVEAGQPTLAGIGHATTVYYAESFADSALQQAVEKEIKGIVIMGEDGTITEYLQNSSKLTYASRIENMEVIEKLQDTSISPKMFSKIEAKLTELKLNSFSAKTLAKEMDMSDRNAQRILSELLSVGLVSYCGTENRSTRGRSAKLYELSKEIYD